MNKVVLSVAALAAISVPVQMQAAEELTDEQMHIIAPVYVKGIPLL